MSGADNLPRWATGALVLAIVVSAIAVVRSFSARPPSSSNPSSSSASPPGGRPPTHPLPEGVTTLEQLIELASTDARTWRADAELTRLYATLVAADARIDRAGSDVQLVFVSAKATRAEETTNGFRWSLQQGKTHAEEISVLPAPQLPAAATKLCPLAPVLGEGAPERVTLDVIFAPRTGSQPVLNAFTREPRKWVVTADARTCQVLGRSQDRTAQESTGEDASDGSDAGWFDVRAAGLLVSGALERASTCGTDAGPHGDGTLVVTFDQQGRVRSTELTAGPFEGTAPGKCIQRLVEKVRVSPWQHGDGRTAARFRM